MKRLFFILILIVIILAACDLVKNKPSTRIIEHDPVVLSIDNTFFEQKGCFQSTSCLPDPFTKADPPITSISKASPWLGGLTPSLPIAVAYTNSAFGLDESKFIFSLHCLGSHYIRYIVHAENEYRIISNHEELAALYAPIESPEEAFSFAIAATGYSPMNDLEKIKKIVLKQKTVEETYVRQSETGFIVHLFDTFMCGCGPHIISSVDVTVQRDGALEIAAPVPAYQDPETDKICFD